jgi:hypothetical protein
MDFKENVNFGKGANEVNRIFYERFYLFILIYFTRLARSVFDVCVIRMINGKRSFKHYTYVSEITTHNWIFVTECLQVFFFFEEIILNRKLWIASAKLAKSIFGWTTAKGILETFFLWGRLVNFNLIYETYRFSTTFASF